ncbi:MAG: hypothetical protein ACLFPE_00220 [Bacteroidales bacterium]
MAGFCRQLLTTTAFGHGIDRNYYEDGTVQAGITYHMGVKHGPQKVF